MKRWLTLSAIFVLLVGGLTSAEAASAAPEAPAIPVSFVLTSATCPYLPAGTTITGSGTESSITVTQNVQNVTTIANQTRARGTATDQDGNTYVFTYDNHYRIANSVADPAKYAGGMTDSFSLVGNGPASLRNGFIAGLTTNAEVTVAYSWNVKRSWGDPIAFDPGPFVAHCDPL